MRDAETYRNLAEKFRALAGQASDAPTAASLCELAEEYDEQARRLGPEPGPPMPVPE